MIDYEDWLEMIEENAYEFDENDQDSYLFAKDPDAVDFAMSQIFRHPKVETTYGKGEVVNITGGQGEYETPLLIVKIGQEIREIELQEVI